MLILIVENAIRNINSLLVEEAEPEELIRQLQRPEANLPPVDDRLPVVHHRELIKEKNNVERVRFLNYKFFLIW